VSRKVLGKQDSVITCTEFRYNYFFVWEIYRYY
jgi:hypothetical protein